MYSRLQQFGVFQEGRHLPVEIDIAVPVQPSTEPVPAVFRGKIINIFLGEPGRQSIRGHYVIAEFFPFFIGEFPAMFRRRSSATL